MYCIREVDGDEESEVIAELHRICCPHDELPSTTDGWWWLAYAGDVAVGYAGMRDAKSEPGAAFLCIAGVVPEHRGKGLQRRLIRVRVQKARRLMKTAVISYTLDNAPSGNNLIACGFRLYSPDKRWEGGDVAYWRRLLVDA
jgi:GNAT superfamily N-acetyltransferase